MKFQDLKNSLQEQIFPIYLIEGEDAFFRNRAVALIKEACLSEPDFNYTRFLGNEIKGQYDELLSAVRSFPFMSEKRVVEVIDFNPTATDLKDKALLEYLKNPEDTTVLIIVNKEKCESLKKLSSVTVVDCQKAGEEVITKYIRAKMTKANLIISTSVCKKIIEYCLSDMSKIDGEINKLIDYCSGRVEVTEKDVEKIVSKDLEYKIFEIVQLVAKRNFDGVYKFINEITSLAEKQQFLVSLYYQFRRMFYASVTKGEPSVVADVLGEKQYSIIKARELASLFSSKRLKEIMQNLARLDGEFKTGKISLDSAFNQAVFSVLTENVR